MARKAVARRVGQNQDSRQRPGNDHDGHINKTVSVDVSYSEEPPSNVEVPNRKIWDGVHTRRTGLPSSHGDPARESLVVRQQREMARLKAGLALQEQAAIREMEEQHLCELAKAAQPEKLELRARADLLLAPPQDSTPSATAVGRLPLLPCGQPDGRPESHMDVGQGDQLWASPSQSTAGEGPPMKWRVLRSCYSPSGTERPSSGKCALAHSTGPVSKASFLSAASSRLSLSPCLPRRPSRCGQKRPRHAVSTCAPESTPDATCIIGEHQRMDDQQDGRVAGITALAEKSAKDAFNPSQEGVVAGPSASPTPPQTGCSKRKNPLENTNKRGRVGAENPSMALEEANTPEFEAAPQGSPAQAEYPTDESPASKRNRSCRSGFASPKSYAAGSTDASTRLGLAPPKRARAQHQQVVVGRGSGSETRTSEASGSAAPKEQSAAGPPYRLRTRSVAGSEKQKVARTAACGEILAPGIHIGDQAESDIPPEAIAAGTSLSYAAVMARLKPRHSRFGHSGGRAVRLTPPKPVAQRSYGVKIRDLSPTMQSQLHEFQEWFAHPPPHCLVDTHDKSTVSHTLQLLLRMMGWMRLKRVVTLASLTLQDLVPSHDKAGATLGRAFVQWMRTKRHVATTTLHLVYRALLPLAIYLHHAKSEEDPPQVKSPYNDVPVIKQFRAYGSLLRHKNKRTLPVANEDLKWIDWDKVVTLLLPELLSECAGWDHNGRPRSLLAVVKSVQRYLMFAIAAVCPDRQRTLRELEMGVTLQKREGRYWIRLKASDHKTGKTAGARPDFQIQETVSKQLDDFYQVWRPLLEPQHKYVFSQANKKPLQASVVTSMFKDAAHRLSGQLMHPQLMRKAIVTHFQSTGASNRELEALARCMGHGLAVQQIVYDRRTRDQRGEPAYNMIAKAYKKLTASAFRYFT